MIILSRGRASGMRRVPRTPATHNLFGHAQSKLFDGPALVLIEALSRHLDPGCAVSHQKNLRPRSQEPQRAAPRSSAHLDAPARSCRRPADDRRQIRTGRSLPASTGSGPLSLFPAPACLLVVSCKRTGRESLRNKRYNSHGTNARDSGPRRQAARTARRGCVPCARRPMHTKRLTARRARCARRPCTRHGARRVTVDGGNGSAAANSLAPFAPGTAASQAQAASARAAGSVAANALACNACFLPLFAFICHGQLH